MWGDRLRSAADLALLGVVLTLASLPVVTAGAAFTTGSFAMNHFVDHDTWPASRAVLAEFRRRLRPGLVAGPAVLAAAGLIALDLRALHRGVVPGGVPMIAVLLLAAAAGVGYLGLVVVRAGRPVPVVGRPASVAVRNPVAVAAATGVVGFTAVLGLLVHPVLLPALVGYALFALHVVARRFGGDEGAQHVVDAGARRAEDQATGQREHLVDC
jgi:hypothetical protein